MSNESPEALLLAAEQQRKEAEVLRKALDSERMRSAEVQAAAERIKRANPGMLRQMVLDAYEADARWKQAGMAVGAAAGAAAGGYGGYKGGQASRGRIDEWRTNRAAAKASNADKAK